jgi:hypothetical protein
MDMGRVAYEGYAAGDPGALPWESQTPGIRERFRAAADAVLMFSDLRRGAGGKQAVGMDFSDALAAVKGGAKITRDGWHGPGMYVVYQPGYPDGIGINANTALATGIPQGTMCSFLPYLMFRTAAGAFVPWDASQTDLLEADWEIVP